MRQLALNISLRDDATFANFFPGRNKALIDYLTTPTERTLYLTGKKGAGLTHLLQAICHRAERSLYLPLRDPTLSPLMLENLEDIELLAIDDIDAVAGNKDWEEALFHIYNKRHLSERRLVIASHLAPINLPIALADLKSRLQAMLLLSVVILSDKEKMAALQLRASGRGLEMPHEVAQYLLQHVPRDMRQLFALLDDLDKKSLQEQRRLTIPFVKQVLYTHSFVLREC